MFFWSFALSTVSSSVDVYHDACQSPSEFPPLEEVLVCEEVSTGMLSTDQSLRSFSSQSISKTSESSRLSFTSMNSEREDESKNTVGTANAS